MPFQGIPNAGAPDPQWFSMLLQARQNRAQLEAAQQKAMLEAEANAQKQRRLDAKHEMEMLAARTKLAIDLQNTLNPAVNQARQSADQASQGYSREDVLDKGGGADFATILQQLEPNRNVAAEVQANDEAQANLASQAMTAAQIYQGMNPGISQAEALNAALGGGRSVEDARARTAELDLNKKLDEERRANTESNRRSRRDYSESVALARANAQIQAEQLPLEVRTFNREILKTRKQLEKAIESGNKEQEELLKRDLSGYVAARDASLSRAQPAEAVAIRMNIEEKASELDRIVRERNLYLTMLKDRDKLGSQPALKSWLSNIINVSGDLGQSVVPALQDYMQNSKASPQEKEKVRRLIQDGYTFDGRKLAIQELAEIRGSFLVVTAFNPDRISNLQYEDVRNASKITGALLSDKRARENMYASVQNLEMAINGLQKSLHRLRPEVTFNKDGSLTTENAPMFEGSAIYPTEPTGVPLTQDPNVSEPWSNMTPVEALRSLRGGP